MDAWVLEYIDWAIAHPARVGLALNIVGTLVIAMVVGQGRGETLLFDQKGRRRRAAVVLRPWWFRFGLLLLVTGFALQLLG